MEITYPQIPGATLPQATLPDVFVYLRYIYNFAIFIAGFLAFVMLVVGGARYIFSTGNPTKLKRARSQIIKAILGLVLIFSAYLLLYTINPQLVIFPTISITRFPQTFIPPVPLIGQPIYFEEMPLGPLITLEYGVSSFIRFHPLFDTSEYKGRDPAFDPEHPEEYTKAFKEVAEYSALFQPKKKYPPINYQGALYGRRLLRIDEVASTTLSAFDMLKELSNNFKDLLDEFNDHIIKLYTDVLQCTCNRCMTPPCPGNSSCECSVCDCQEPPGDVCPNRDEMDKLRNEILPSYYKDENDPFNCEFYLMKYLGGHLKRFLNSRGDRPLVKNDDDNYKDKSYWYSDEAKELREKIQNCISASNNWEDWIQAPPRGQDFKDLYEKIEDIIWKNSTTSLAVVENKGTVSPVTDPPQRDIKTNIDQISHILNLIKQIKTKLNPRLYPSSSYVTLTHSQFYHLKTEMQFKEFPIKTLSFLLEPGLDLTDDPLSFFRPPWQIFSQNKINKNLAFAQEKNFEELLPSEEEISVSCDGIAEIPVGKATDEAIKLIEDVLRELKNIHQKGNEVINKVFQQGEIATNDIKNLIENELKPNTSSDSCDCGQYCEHDCITNYVTICDKDGNCETHCSCECICTGNACPLDEINQAYFKIEAKISQIKQFFIDIDRLIGNSDDVVEDNEITNTALTSIYESYFKLNGFYPKGHPKEKELVPIGRDDCCSADNAHCRDKHGNLEVDKIEKKNYSLIEKLIEVQKLLNRARDFEKFRYLIKDALKHVSLLKDLDLVKKEEIKNAETPQNLSGIEIGGDLSLVKCQQLFIETQKFYGKQGPFMILENWMEGREKAHISYEMCPPDPPLECDYFNSQIFRKKIPLNCYAYDEEWFKDYPELASDFFCCIKKE